MHLRPQPRVRRVPTGRQDAVSLCCLLFGAQVGRRSAWQPFVFIELEGVKHRRRTTARDREAARPQPDPDHGALCASGAGFGQGLGGAGRRQYRRGFAERRWCHSGETGGGAVVTLGRARQKGSAFGNCPSAPAVERNLSTTLRHRRFLFTDSFLLLWKWRGGLIQTASGKRGGFRGAVGRSVRGEGPRRLAGYVRA